MSDHTPASHHNRKKVHVLGTCRKKKYLKILIILLVAAAVAVGWYIVTSGILADENPEISRHLITRINNERLAHNLPPVQESSTLAHQALLISQEIRVSPTAYNSWSNTPSEPGTDYYIYPKLSWALSGISLEPMLFDAWQTTDTGFTTSILDKDTREVGIGITSEGYNYVVVTRWQ